ncbi:MAG TPA: response regulator transcription factor [Anaerolineales bacterium]
MRTILINYNITLISSLKDFLEAFLDIVIVGAFRESEIAFEQLPSLDPDIVIIDLDMQNAPGDDLIRQLRGISTDLVIVAIATANTKGFRETILAAGANAYIPKAKLAKDLIPAVRREISGLSGWSTA